MEPDYKHIAEQLSFELVEIEERSQREGNTVNAVICSLVAQGVITGKQYEDKVKQLRQIQKGAYDQGGLS